MFFQFYYLSIKEAGIIRGPSNNIITIINDPVKKSNFSVHLIMIIVCGLGIKVLLCRLNIKVQPVIRIINDIHIYIVFCSHFRYDMSFAFINVFIFVCDIKMWDICQSAIKV